MHEQNGFRNDVLNSNEDLLDLLIFYVEDVCDQKIKDLTQQVQIYTLICELLISTIAVTWIFYGVKWILGPTNLSEAKKEFFIEKSERESNDVEEKLELSSSGNSKWHGGNVTPHPKLETRAEMDFPQKKDIHLPVWDIPKIVKEKALFWKPQSKQDYCGYDSLIDFYGDQTQSKLSDIDKVSCVENLQSMSSYNNNMNGTSFRKTNSFSQSDLESDFSCNSDYSTARIASQSSIQKTPVLQSSKTQFEEEEQGIGDLNISLKLKNDLYLKECDSTVSQSMVLEDTSDESEDEDNVPNRNFCKTSENSNDRRKSRSEGSMVLTSPKLLDQPDSMAHTMNMAKIGPTYLYVYMNIMYGNWDEFEYRTLVKDPLIYKSREKLHFSELTELLRVIKKRSLHEFKKNGSLSKLESIRFAFNNNKFHNQILNVIIDNVNFLCKVIKHKRFPGAHKLEIYRLFFYSFCFETETQLSFEFASKIINSMIYSLSYLERSSIEFCDGLRCLHGILCSTNVEDFSGEIFDNCLKDVNSFRFERQSVLWEVLKLVFCEWLLDAETIKDINYINNTLRRKVEQLINGYVEKDNNKFQEFMIIWRMLLQTRKPNIKSDSENEISTKRKTANSIPKVKRNLSSVRKNPNGAKLHDVSNIM
ncbi:hypothetical protein CANINC_000904 [Pichia inconspicua]|uniref:Uncharacterized protein n=1 Tax=Pichia inconspicua TaxID=52247 RepID=A0A4V4NG44_9ASCO|nr:hypothetical protein CANINC_000904 [[Candida] inconspicua]